MKIYLKLENGKRFFIPAPMWFVKAGLGDLGVRFAKKHIPEERRANIENIDFRELKKALDVLKMYKGLTMVDVKAKDGTEVKIVV
ncbi:MAG: hypothetical protein PHC91_08915 [Eubacteriales bacterium]|nr:hypothetical protein [Eubacteriales bacterium]